MGRTLRAILGYLCWFTTQAHQHLLCQCICGFDCDGSMEITEFTITLIGGVS